MKPIRAALVSGPLVSALVVVGGCLAGSSGRGPIGAPGRAAALPRTMLWVWERPGDLSFVTSPEVGVAYLAGTITLSARRFTSRPRLQPLVLSPTSAVMAVIRIETDQRHREPLAAGQQAGLAAEILRLAAGRRVAGLQIDFDAPVSERTFYRGLLSELRRRMPSGWPLSITALASWCLGDPWIRDLPIDEAVPMLFQMGPDAREVRARLEARQDFALAVCRGSIGIAVGEWAPRMPGRRRYIFTAGGWAPAVLGQLGIEP